MRFLGVFIIVAAMISSCNSNPFKEEIAEIDSMSNVLDSLEHSVASLDPDTLAKWNAYANSRASVIKRKLRDTAFANKHLDIISEVIADAKYLEKMSQARSELSQELSYTQTQLEKLMVDLKSNAIDSAKAFEYMASERMAVLNLENDVNKRVPLAKSAIESLSSLSVELDSLMNYMDQNGYFTP